MVGCLRMVLSITELKDAVMGFWPICALYRENSYMGKMPHTLSGQRDEEKEQLHR